jgi:hypothetical protein
MAISYGSAADGKQIAKSYEWLAVQDNEGEVADNILKYTRTETTTETVESTFGCPTLDSNEVLNATITWSVDEALVESGTSSATPQAVQFYNVKCEASVTFLGSANLASTFSFDGTTFDTVSSEVSETLGDVKKVTVRGVAYGENNSLTLGGGTAGGTIRKEKRFSNTDFVRTSATTVAFGGS